MAVKISITIDEDSLRFVDALESNRSQIIDRIINRAKKQDVEKKLKQAYIDRDNDPQCWSEFKLWDSTVGDGIDEQA